MNKTSREDVVSPELAPERFWQPKGISNVYTFRPRVGRHEELTP
jgi:hypothetical protein